MQIESNHIQGLVEKAEAYGKTSAKLIELKVVEKSSRIISGLFVFSVFAIVVFCLPLLQLLAYRFG